MRTREWEMNPTTIQEPTTLVKFLRAHQSWKYQDIYFEMKDKLLHLILPPQKKRGDAWWAFLDFGGTICHIEYAVLIHLESHIISLPVSRRDHVREVILFCHLSHMTQQIH